MSMSLWVLISEICIKISGKLFVFVQFWLTVIFHAFTMWALINYKKDFWMLTVESLKIEVDL